MNTDMRYLQGSVVVFLVLIVTFSGSLTGVSAETEESLDLYVAPETEYIPVGELISYLLETKLGFEVNQMIQYSDVGLRKVASGQGDLFLGLELPPRRGGSWPYSSYDLCDLGPVFEDVVVGWGVPSYVPAEKLGTVEDLKKEETKNRLHREIIILEERETLLEASEKILRGDEALEEYKMVKLRESVANSEFGRAVRNEEWVVMTLKRPGLPYSLYDVRFIKELTEEQSLHLFARNDLMARFPSDVTQFLSRFYLPVSLANELISSKDKDQKGVGRRFSESHPELVHYWIEGVDSL
ncbi:MAG: glycine betaine ABC transporter substrate-binding protein [Candidatus Bipolaricaulota bacterium]